MCIRQMSFTSIANSHGSNSQNTPVSSQTGSHGLNTQNAIATSQPAPIAQTSNAVQHTSSIIAQNSMPVLTATASSCKSTTQFNSLICLP